VNRAPTRANISACAGLKKFDDFFLQYPEADVFVEILFRLKTKSRVQATAVKNVKCAAKSMFVDAGSRVEPKQHRNKKSAVREQSDRRLAKERTGIMLFGQARGVEAVF
jgi:hypothetical protein